MGHLHLAAGQIKSRLDSQWHSYTMRTLNSKDLPDVLALYDMGMECLDSPELLWRYPDETVAAFLTSKAIAAGVFVHERLVGFRVLYFHDEGDLDNPLFSVGFSHNLTAHSALCVIDPEFRGNALQKQLGINILQAAKEQRIFENFCSVVSPQNYASIKDKFSLDMLIVKLEPRFSGLWRYIFYQNMNQVWQVNHSDIVFVPSYEYIEQIRLIDQGYYGFSLGESQGRAGVYFGRLDKTKQNETAVIA